MTAILAGQSDIGLCGPEASIYVYNEGKEDYIEVFEIGRASCRERV